MTLWEILKANKTGIAPDMFTMLAASKMNGGRDRLHELSGIPPLSFTAKGKPLTAWSINGNTVQNGTPTPDNPIMPQGTGDLETVGTKAGQYKIPISSANTTTPIYLGEVETTRKIKKLVLDSAENWKEGTSNYYIFINVSGKGNCIPNSTALSTHTEKGVVANNNGTALFFKKSVFIHSSLADFKTYLAQQYAAGTPVTVWYVLATEETAVVNEPLMKIGDYADTLSMEQAGVQIPTINGTTVIDVDTAVKPESMTIKYRR